jgi:hypothetical protein
MKYGSLSLQPVYQTIKQIHGNPAKPPNIPPRRSSEFKDFRLAYTQLIRVISGDRGVYLWIGKPASTQCEFIYVGESRRNRCGLRGRIDDEFNKWYHIYWMTVFHSDKYESEIIRMYNTPTKDYSSEVKNVSLKRGSTHLLYCYDFPDGLDIKTVQDDLIQLFGNPRGNAKDFRNPPFPEDRLLSISNEVRHALEVLVQEVQPYTL